MDDISNKLIEQQLLRESPLEQLQYQREAESKESAKQKLAKDVQKDEVNANAGSSIWGISLRNQFVGLMVDEQTADKPTASHRTGCRPALLNCSELRRHQIQTH